MTKVQSSAGRAYNVSLVQINDAVETEVKTRGTNTTNMVKFRGTMKLRDKTVERTVIARGKAADAIRANLEPGATHSLRVLFETAPLLEGAKTAGQFLTVVGIPMSRAELAAAKTAKAA